MQGRETPFSSALGVWISDRAGGAGAAGLPVSRSVSDTISASAGVRHLYCISRPTDRGCRTGPTLPTPRLAVEDISITCRPACLQRDVQSQPGPSCPTCMLASSCARLVRRTRNVSPVADSGPPRPSFSSLPAWRSVAIRQSNPLRSQALDAPDMALIVVDNAQNNHSRRTRHTDCPVRPAPPSTRP